MENEFYEDYLDEEEYEIPKIKCVGVKDTKNGISIILISMEDEIIESYDIDFNVKKYDDKELFKVCYSISKEINNLYYMCDGNIAQEQVLNVVREKIKERG